MKIFKRTAAFVLCVIMLFTCFSFAGFSLETQNGIVYTVSKSGSVTVTGYKGSESSISVPSSIDSRSVTVIASRAFSECRGKSLTVTVPDSVTSIAEDAFCGVKKLTVKCNDNSFAKYYAYTLKNLTKLWSDEPEQYPDETVVSLTGAQAAFTPCRDVKKSDWYYAPSGFAAQHGIIKGYADGRFGATDKMQRQDFAVILSRLCGFVSDESSAYTPVFGDVRDSSQYYFEPVCFLHAKRIISGYQNGNFGVGDGITREQVCMFLQRLASYYGIDTSPKTNVGSSFSDFGTVSAFAKDAVSWCVSLHIINGSGGKILPSKQANRAEVTTLVGNFINYCIYGNKYVPAPAPTPDTGINNNWVKSNLPYYIRVNRTQNLVIIYKKDADGHFNIPVKAMACSVGLNGKTPTGTYSTTDKYTWRFLSGNVWGQYATRITGHYLFHSVPYYSKSKSDLEYNEYNKLGQPASLGCIRLCVADAKWIYDNCPSGTVVTIYDSSAKEPMAKPAPVRINTGDSRRGWDPTDPDPRNPW